MTFVSYMRNVIIVTAKVCLTPGRMHFHIGDVSFYRVISPALTRIVSVQSYNKRLAAVKLLVEFSDGSTYIEQFSIKEELRLLNYPQYSALCKSIEGVALG